MQSGRPFTMVAAIVSIGALSSVAGCGGSHQATTTTTTLSSTTELATTTAAPTTTTLPINAQIGALLHVTPKGFATENHEVDAAVQVANLSTKSIAAYQVRFAISVQDNLGRTFTKTVLDDCTPQSSSPPGQLRNMTSGMPAGAVWGPPPAYGFNSAPTVDAQALIVEGEVECTYLKWSMNQFIPEEAGIYNAVANGAIPTLGIVFTRVTFTDGSSIGTAEVG